MCGSEVESVKGGRKTHRIGGEVSLAWLEWDQIGVCFAVVDRRLLRFGAVFGSVFASQWWIGIWDARWLTFGSLIGVWFVGLIGVWIVLSLSRYICLLSVFCCVLFAECVSLFCTCYGNRLKIKRLCKMISGSTSVNFGQTEIIFRKIYFP